VEVFENPFTPIFGGRPDVFFGRKTVLGRFRRALIDRGSAERALFITGTRGSGKTVLVEQLSQRARQRHWHTIDLGAEKLTRMFLHKLVERDEQTKTISPQARLGILGSGGSVSAGPVSKTVTYVPEDLQHLFLAACTEHPKGVFVSIDEVQKVPLDDIAVLCETFQMASRKGHNVILVLPGLPYAYDKIIHHEGCTFMRRGVRERVGLFTREDTISAFTEAFATIDGLTIGADEIETLCNTTMGHPYLMQLHGYYLISSINDRVDSKTYRITQDDVSAIPPAAIDGFERHALRPMMNELSALERT